LQECFIAFPFGGNEWLRQLAIKERRDRWKTMTLLE
jgi:hypothetical protein